jgi:uncharacterized membrane protein
VGTLPRVELRSNAAASWGLKHRLPGALRLPELVRQEPLLFALTGFALLAYALYSIWEHNHFLTDYDLAIADQAVWNFSRFQSPEITTTVPPVNVLGDHFSPILILLSPLYWLWSDPRMLLIAQAALIAASIVPVFLFAEPRMGRVGGYLLAAAYSLFWGISAAVGYQFHDVAFSPLLVALCILFADRRQWTPFFVSLAGLLLVKESMSVLAVFIGLWLLTGRELRVGAITIAAGVIWYFLAVDVLIPGFAEGTAYTHWTYTSFGADAPSAVGHIATHPLSPLEELVNDPEKRRTLAYLFLPFLGLILCSRLALLCIPLVAQQMFSASPLFWGPDFHYWLAIAPVLAMGSADGFHNLIRRLDFERSLAASGGLVAAIILLANIGLATKFSLWTIATDFSFSATETDRLNQRLLDQVPGDASVTASAHLLPHLSQRSDLYLLGYPAPTTEYVIIGPDAFGWPDPAFAHEWLEGHRPVYRTVYEQDDWAVWRRAA